MSTRLKINEPRLHRMFALPFTAFSILVALRRQWGLQTNAEVITRLLLDAAPQDFLPLTNTTDDDEYRDDGSSSAHSRKA